MHPNGLPYPITGMGWSLASHVRTYCISRAPIPDETSPAIAGFDVGISDFGCLHCINRTSAGASLTSLLTVHTWRGHEETVEDPLSQGFLSGFEKNDSIPNLPGGSEASRTVDFSIPWYGLHPYVKHPATENVRETGGHPSMGPGPARPTYLADCIRWLAFRAWLAERWFQPAARPSPVSVT